MIVVFVSKYAGRKGCKGTVFTRHAGRVHHVSVFWAHAKPWREQGFGDGCFHLPSGSARWAVIVGNTAQDAGVHFGTFSRKGGNRAGVGRAGRWAYIFVGAATARIVPVEGVGSTNIRKIGVDNCDGGSTRITFPCKNLVTMLISC